MVEMWSSIPYNASLVDAVDMVVSPRHEKHVKVRGAIKEILSFEQEDCREETRRAYKIPIST